MWNSRTTPTEYNWRNKNMSKISNVQFPDK